MKRAHIWGSAALPHCVCVLVSESCVECHHHIISPKFSCFKVSTRDTQVNNTDVQLDSGHFLFQNSHSVTGRMWIELNNHNKTKHHCYYKSSQVEFDYIWQTHKQPQNCANRLEENTNQVLLELSSSRNICNKSEHFLTQVHFCNTEKPEQHSSLLVSCWKREVFSRGATSKQNLSSMCIHCNAKQISNASASLKALLSITMS